MWDSAYMYFFELLVVVAKPLNTKKQQKSRKT